MLKKCARRDVPLASFVAAAEFVEWPDAAANQAFFAGEIVPLLETIASIQKEAGVIEEVPDLRAMTDPSFVKAMR